MDDLSRLGAVDAGKLVARKELSVVELVSNSINQIDKLDSKLNSFILRLDDQALKRAQILDAELKNSGPRGPLHGVPIAVKDLCDMQGVPTYAGLPNKMQAAASVDATIIDRLQEAGCVIVGKTQLSEGALALHHPEVKRPVNPINSKLWTGSSSSGSGVSVASYMVPAAIGTDTGGSIRFPALCNGIVGLKPTWGRVSRNGIFPLSWTLDHVGPLARKVEDTASVLQTIAGRDPLDTTTSLEKVPNYLSDIKKGIKGLVIGFDEHYSTDGVHQETVDALSGAIQVFSDAGAEIKSYQMPNTKDANAAWTPICLSEAFCVHQKTLLQENNNFSDTFKEALEYGKQVTGADYARANIERLKFSGELQRIFEVVDLLLVPVTPNEVPTVDEFAKICPDPDGLERLIKYTCLYDVAGNPTITLPAGFSKDGIPFAFQLVAPRFGEGMLFNAGEIWEKQTS